MTGPKFGRGAAPPKGERIPHQEPRFVMRSRNKAGTWDIDWIHCKRCLAKNAGRSTSGEPRYSGGFVIAATTDKPRGAVIPCDCSIGEQYRRRHEAFARKRLARLASVLESDIRYPTIGKDTEIAGPFGEDTARPKWLPASAEPEQEPLDF